MTRSELPDLNGLLVVDKPAGMTSHDVVGRVRRMVAMKRVGHGGTLDPFATGVLVVAVGRATRVLQFVQGSDKAYHALIALGVETDSADVDGAVVARDEPADWPSRDEVAAALGGFVGMIEQIPPAHSAIKVGGRKLYELARAGQLVNVPSRTVAIYGIELLRYDPPWLEIGVACGKGTYIRSLARDIGAALGTGAYCHGLRRTRNGPFCLGDAWSLDELAELDLRARWNEVATHPDAALASLPAALLSEEQTRAWYHGRLVALDLVEVGDAHVRVYGTDGRFVGIGAPRGDQLTPALVFPVVEEDVDGDAAASRRD